MGCPIEIDPREDGSCSSRVASSAEESVEAADVRRPDASTGFGRGVAGAAGADAKISVVAAFARNVEPEDDREGCSPSECPAQPTAESRSRYRPVARKIPGGSPTPLISTRHFGTFFTMQSEFLQGPSHRSHTRRSFLSGPERPTLGSVRFPAPPLGLFMALAILAVMALAFWDAQRESTNSLDDFAREQGILARGIAAAVSARVQGLSTDAPSRTSATLLSDVRPLERPSSLRVLLVRPDREGLSTTDDRGVRVAKVEQALDAGLPTVRLDRKEASVLGLPWRAAVVGLSTFSGPGGRWGIVVATTALRERDRAVHAEWRSVIAVVLASGLVFIFGGLALRKQRKELELGRELAIAELQRERERQLVQIDKLATLAALATGIAHEVSTPLGVIVGRAEQLLPKVNHDDRARKCVESIIEQGDRISRVVRGFLNLARGEAPTLERVNPGAVASAASNLVKHRFDKASVRMRLSADPSLPTVSGDPRLLEQVLINLLLNACDACGPSGLVEVSVTSRGDRVVFVVEDDGAGITAEAAARATEPFFTTKPAGQGTGLGLAIAAEIVKHHGGRFSIGPRARTNEPGNEGVTGTRAMVELPVAKDVT